MRMTEVVKYLRIHLTDCSAIWTNALNNHLTDYSAILWILSPSIPSSASTKRFQFQRNKKMFIVISLQHKVAQKAKNLLLRLMIYYHSINYA